VARAAPKGNQGPQWTTTTNRSCAFFPGNCRWSKGFVNMLLGNVHDLDAGRAIQHLEPISFEVIFLQHRVPFPPATKLAVRAHNELANP
jgi:hypothetical protein